MNIVAYCRVSTDKEDQLNSLEQQKEFFTEYSTRMGENLVKVYADEGISGTKTRNRTAFLQMMEDAEKGYFEAVVVKDISRLARNTVDLLQSVRKLKSLGIETIFLTANMTSMGNSEFILTIFGALAQEESANMSKRVKFGKKMNAEKGRVPNIIFGYDKIPGEYFSLKINETEANWIRQIFKWYTEEGYGSGMIAKMLNDRGVTTKRGCAWSQHGICRILKNRIYIGEIINGKSEVKDFLTGERSKKKAEEWFVIEKPELQIVDTQVFEKAQEILNTRVDAFQNNKERHSNKYLFSTLIKCKECGWSYARTVMTYKNTYVRWSCSGHKMRKTSGCENISKIEEYELIDVLESYFKDLLKNEKDVKQQIIKEFKKLYGEKQEEKKSKASLEQQIKRLKKSKEKYTEMYADELISKDELSAKIKKLNCEINSLEQELKMLLHNVSQSDLLEKVMDETFKSIEQIVDVGSMTNEQIKRIVDKIVIDDKGKVEIYMKPIQKVGMKKPAVIEQKAVEIKLSKSKKKSRIMMKPDAEDKTVTNTHNCMYGGLAYAELFRCRSDCGIGAYDVMSKLKYSFLYIILHWQTHTPCLFVKTIYALRGGNITRNFFEKTGMIFRNTFSRYVCEKMHKKAKKSFDYFVYKGYNCNGSKSIQYTNGHEKYKTVRMREQA